MNDIRMPRLSDSMEEGLVLQWLIADGGPVQAGEDLVEIETDKATMTYQAEADGRLSIVVAEGTTVAVGEVIAQLGEPAEARPGGAGPHPAEREPVAVSAGAPQTDGVEDAGTPATPVARRLASLHGVELAALRGSGPRGRITKADVATAAGIDLTERRPPAPAPERVPLRPEATTNGSATQDRGPARTTELTRLQQLVARRMSEAKATIPHFQVQTEVLMDRAVALRQEFKDALADDPGCPAPSLNDLIVKASGLALARHPQANASYRDGLFELHDGVNVGIAVAAEGALVVPTIFDTDTKSLGQIAREARVLAERVRAGQITPPELSGATFTVSNLGMFGMTAITPVVNPPQAAILGAGAVRNVLAREAGGIVDRALLTLTLSCDHRILYGADAARFLAEIRELLESPLRLCA